VSDRVGAGAWRRYGGAASDCGFGAAWTNQSAEFESYRSCCRQATRLAFDARSRDGRGNRRAFAKRFVGVAPAHRIDRRPPISRSTIAPPVRQTAAVRGIGETGVMPEVLAMTDAALGEQTDVDHEALRDTVLAGRGRIDDLEAARSTDPGADVR